MKGVESSLDYGVNKRTYAGGRRFAKYLDLVSDVIPFFFR